MLSCGITPALAQVGSVAQIAPQTANVQAPASMQAQEDAQLAYAFGGEDIQAHDISQAEMEQTQGAFWGIVVRAIMVAIIATIGGSEYKPDNSGKR